MRYCKFRHAMIFVLFFTMLTSLAHARGVLSDRRMERAGKTDGRDGGTSLRQSSVKDSDELMQAKLFYVQEQYQRAVDSLKPFVFQYDRHRDLDEAYFYLGLAYDALGDSGNASVCWDRLIYQKGSDEHRLRALIAKGRQSLRLGKTFEAMRLYELSLSMAPLAELPSDVLLKLVELYRQYDREDQALQLEQMLRKTIPLLPVAEISPAPSVQESVSRDKCYSLQVGAFSALKNALKVKKRLSLRGYDAFVLHEKKAKSPIYKVRVGQFKQKSQILRMQKDIWAQEKMKGSVVFDYVPR